MLPFGIIEIGMVLLSGVNRMQLEQFLECSAARDPDKLAIVCEERRLSYGELDSAANRLAHGLIAAGVSRGDRVALYLDNGVEVAISLFAALKAGAVFMPVNPTTKADKLLYLLQNSRAAALICPVQKLDTLEPCLTQATHLQTVVTVGDRATAPHPRIRMASFDELLIDHASQSTPPHKRCISIDLAALIYTSGSTGNAKGVMLTHLNMTTASTSITTYLENRPDDIILNALPMSFDYGLYQLLMSVQVGGTLVLECGFTFPDQVLRSIERERVTGFPLVPTMASMLLQLDLSPYDLSSIRYLTNTAAALPTEHIRRLRSLFPQAALYSMYGLTECKRVSYLPPDELDRRPESVGRGMPNQEVYIVDDAGERVPPGDVGELVVRGAHVMRGYWENPVETDKRLKPGPLPGEQVLYTGDLFRADAEGFLYFVGRRDDIIKTRGEKVAPREVENALTRHPAVAEATVFGVADDLLGSAIHACVTLRADATTSVPVLRRHCASLLEDFMVPQVITIVESIPRTPNGKFDRAQLAAVARSGGSVVRSAAPAAACDRSMA